MTIHEQRDSIRTREDLLRFIEALRTDYVANPTQWAHSDVGQFLEAIAACVRDNEAVGNIVTETPSWRTFADLLICGRTYE